MIEISIAFIISSFVAGLLMFLAPCTLPLVPAYLAFITGVPETDIATSRSKRKRLVINAFAFVLGFTFVFVTFGIVAGLLGFWAGQFRVLLSQIGGVFIIIFALMMLGVFRFTVLQKNHQFAMPKVFTPGTPLAAWLIGATFALGWTPCVGPVLASILLLASSSATVWSGALMLFIFSLGLAIPFMLVAVLYGRATLTIARYSYLSKFVNVVGGVFLLIIGFLLVTDSFGLMVEYGYRVFYWFGFESLFDYL